MTEQIENPEEERRKLKQFIRDNPDLYDHVQTADKKCPKGQGLDVCEGAGNHQSNENLNLNLMIMPVYTNNEFKGFYPVGPAAVVVADNKEQATEMLTSEMKKRGLPNPEVEPNQFKKVKTRTKGVIILNDGNY